MNLDDTFHTISTLIKTINGEIELQGSGFFYQEYGEKNPKQPEWVAIKEIWLVSNRHIILPVINEKESIPDKLIFNLRKIEHDQVKWIPVELSKDEIIKRAKFHKNPDVDVAIIPILDLVTNIIKEDSPMQEKEKGPHHTSIMSPIAMSIDKLPGNNKIKVEVADDVITIGYPRGFYDEKNIYPIVKSGIIASRWNANFNGLPFFLIDTKLFPGSSGSLVLSKPTDVVAEDGKIFGAKEKQFAFLGIFSGEPSLNLNPIETDEMIIQLTPKFNVGIVWYGYLIDEIIKNHA